MTCKAGIGLIGRFLFLVIKYLKQNHFNPSYIMNFVKLK